MNNESIVTLGFVTVFVLSYHRAPNLLVNLILSCKKLSNQGCAEWTTFFNSKRGTQPRHAC